MADAPSTEYIHVPEHSDGPSDDANALVEVKATRLDMSKRLIRSDYSQVPLFVPLHARPGAAADGVLVCVPPKTGSTSFLHSMYYAMTGTEYDARRSCSKEELESNSYNRKAVWIHIASLGRKCGWETIMRQVKGNRDVWKLRSLLNSTRTGDSALDVFSFALTRDPIFRAISGFKSKVDSVPAPVLCLTRASLPPTHPVLTSHSCYTVSALTHYVSRYVLSSVSTVQVACARMGYGTDTGDRVNFVHTLLKMANRQSSDAFRVALDPLTLSVPAAVLESRCAARHTCCLSFEDFVDTLFRVTAINEAIHSDKAAGRDGWTGKEMRLNPHFASQTSLCRHDVLTYSEMVRLEDLSESSFETLNTKLGNAIEPLSDTNRTVMRPLHLHASEGEPPTEATPLVRVLHPSGTGGTSICQLAKLADGVRLTSYQMEHNCNLLGAGPHDFQSMTSSSPWRRCNAVDRAESNWYQIEYAFDADFPCEPGDDVTHVMLFREPFEMIDSLIRKYGKDDKFRSDEGLTMRVMRHYTTVLETGRLFNESRQYIPGGKGVHVLIGEPYDVTRNIDNPMIRFLIGSEEGRSVPFGEVERRHLSRARDLVAAMDIVMETPDVSYALDVFKIFLPGEFNVHFEDKVLSHVLHSNEHMERPASKEETELRERLEHLFRKQNALDYELYEFMLSQRTLTREKKAPDDEMDIPDRAEDLLFKLSVVYSVDFEMLGHLYNIDDNRKKYLMEIMALLLDEKRKSEPPS